MTRSFAAAALLAGLSGCLASGSVRLPECTPRSLSYERSEARVHDPYPSEDIGPETFNRPPGFTQQRAAPRRVREQTGLSGLRQQYGRPVLPLGLRPGYGGAVR